MRWQWVDASEKRISAINTENFGKPGVVDYRNPRIADALKVFGLVQRFGIGIQTAQAELLINGNPPVELKLPSATFDIAQGSAAWNLLSLRKKNDL
jgi:ATP-dependent DNA helicase RecG